MAQRMRETERKRHLKASQRKKASSSTVHLTLSNSSRTPKGSQTLFSHFHIALRVQGNIQPHTARGIDLNFHSSWKNIYGEPSHARDFSLWISRPTFSVIFSPISVPRKVFREDRPFLEIAYHRSRLEPRLASRYQQVVITFC